MKRVQGNTHRTNYRSDTWGRQKTNDENEAPWNATQLLKPTVIKHTKGKNNSDDVNSWSGVQIAAHPGLYVQCFINIEEWKLRHISWG
jgi:hypothetical protein